jgi:hypothetical protein
MKFVEVLPIEIAIPLGIASGLFGGWQHSPLAGLMFFITLITICLIIRIP